MNKPISFSFVDVNAAEGNQLAASLLISIRDADRGLQAERCRTNTEAQDYGSTLALVLGSAAVGSVAKGIAQWIAKHSGTTVRIQSADGTSVDVRYAEGQDIAQIVKAALQRS